MGVFFHFYLFSRGSALDSRHFINKLGSFTNNPGISELIMKAITVIIYIIFNYIKSFA